MSYRYGTRSRLYLNGTDSRLVSIFEVAIHHIDITILEGPRNEARQNALCESGDSTLRYPDGKHNATPSLALDFSPYPIDWNDEARFLVLAYYLRGIANTMGIAVRLGADWDGAFSRNPPGVLDDLGHIELIEGGE